MLSQDILDRLLSCFSPAAARVFRRPTSDADLPQLCHAGLGISLLAAEAAAEGRHATAGLLSTGVVEFLLQVSWACRRSLHKSPQPLSTKNVSTSRVSSKAHRR